MSQLPGDPYAQQYVAYPRGSLLGGSSQNVRLLTEGYGQINLVFFLGIVFQFAIGFSAGALQINDLPMYYLLSCAALANVVALVSLAPTRKIGRGLGWSPAKSFVIAVVLGLQGWLCCGAIGVVLLQAKAAQELKHYGLKPGFLGFKKAEVESVLRRLEANASAPPPLQP